MKREVSLVPKKTKGRAQIVTVTGGKGGIGKTFITVNLAVELKKNGYKVLIFDGDINMSNVNILLHIDENRNFSDFIKNRIQIEDLIQKGVGGVDAVYVGDELDKTIDLGDTEINSISEALVKVENDYDFILIDSRAGMDKFTKELILLSDRIILCANPEITALVDMYKMIKILTSSKPNLLFEILVNKSHSAENAVNIYNAIRKTVSDFKIKCNLSFLGYILFDQRRVMESIQKRTPISLLSSGGNINQCLNLITASFLKGMKPPKKKSFFTNLFGSR